MLDRLSLNLVSLPDKTYTSVLLLSSPSAPQLTAATLDKVFASMVPGAKWRSWDDALGGCDKLALLLAGFLVELDDSGSSILVKPDILKSVPLRPRKKADGTSAVVPKAVVPAPAPVPALINGVGFVDYGDDLDEDEDLIDEDTLLDDADLATPIQQRMNPPLLFPSFFRALANAA